MIEVKITIAEGKDDEDNIEFSVTPKDKGTPHEFEVVKDIISVVTDLWDDDDVTVVDSHITKKE